MTIHGMWHIFCEGDDCPAHLVLEWPEGAETKGVAVAKARLAAHKAGWIYDEEDLCPECAKRLEGG